MIHIFSQPIFIPIQHSINSKQTVVIVCSKCGYQAVQSVIGYEEDYPDCPGYSDQPIPSREDILRQYAINYYKKNKERLDKYDEYLKNLHQVHYNKKVEWDE